MTEFIEVVESLVDGVFQTGSSVSPFILVNDEKISCIHLPRDKESWGDFVREIRLEYVNVVFVGEVLSCPVSESSTDEDWSIIFNPSRQESVLAVYFDGVKINVRQALILYDERGKRILDAWREVGDKINIVGNLCEPPAEWN